MRLRCGGGRCGKVTYPDLATAWAAALRVSTRLGPMRAYPCDKCPGYHLTTRRIWVEART